MLDQGGKKFALTSPLSGESINLHGVKAAKVLLVLPEYRWQAWEGSG
jgi:hypothetical protein